MGRSRVIIEKPKKPTTPIIGGREDIQIGLTSFENVQIVNANTIKLDRQIYSRNSFNQVINTGFEELQRKEDTFTTTQFFKLYDSLFFDIPKRGKFSHAFLIRKSREYLNDFNESDPKDTTINSLNERIIELEQELLLSSQTDPEHPFFKNGTLVAEAINGSRTGTFYYMDKGYKRKVDFNPTFYGTLLNVLGYNSAEDYPSASRNMLSQIKTGPNLSEGNFDQSTYIRDNELFVGSNITDDTKDALINSLRTEVENLTQRVEDLQSLLDESNTGPINQGGGVDTGGTFNGEPTFGGQFGNNGPI